MSEPRQSTNALYNDNKLKLGVFGPNVSHGCAATTAEGHLVLNWQNSKDIVLTADRMGIEALVPVARWKGFGGPTNFNGESYEPLTWAAAMGALSNHVTVFSTTHVPTMHPVAAAKQCVTADHASSGRFALNVVCGWAQPELELFGTSVVPHEKRYEMAAEWVEIVRRLWTEGEFDFEGRYFKIPKGVSNPKPLQKPHPPIMNAGASPIGARFAAQYADIAFAALFEGQFEANKAQIDNLRRTAREEFHRELQVWTGGWVVCRPTEKEARDYAHYYIHEKGDWEAAENLTRELGIKASAYLSAELVQLLKYRFLAGWGGLPLIGTPEQIVDQLAELSRAGLDGVVLSWVNYHQEMRDWGRDVMPLLEQAGLRKPFQPATGP
jgi:dimethylsulfone monooxygenase